MSTPVAAPPTPDPASPAAEPEVERLALGERLLTGSSSWIGLILVGLIVVFSVLSFENFVSASNARNIATDAAVLLVLAVGSTFVIITAGIDLSIGSVLVFSGVVSAKAMNGAGRSCSASSSGRSACVVTSVMRPPRRA